MTMAKDLNHLRGFELWPSRLPYSVRQQLAGTMSPILNEIMSLGGQNSGHGNGDITNQEDKNVVKAITVRVVVGRVEDEGLEKDKDIEGKLGSLISTLP